MVVPGTTKLAILAAVSTLAVKVWHITANGTEEFFARGWGSNPVSARSMTGLVDREATGPIVLTTCGPVEGVLEADGLAGWLGIPYAEPPLRDLRWRPPQPTCWSGKLQAFRHKSMCPQLSADQVVGDEDCLHLNVHRKPAPAGEALLPVMFFIHGGSLVTGDSRTEFRTFMRHGCPDGCIVVTIQYRLDVLGWLANGALSQEQGGVSGNYGLMDQIESLHWVQRNIAAFGGDRDRVTVMGQSSGGTSVFALLGSPAAKGLFSRAISLSGSPNITMDLATAERQNAKITAGCSGSGPGLLSCLRGMDVESLLRAKPPCWRTPLQDILPSNPHEWYVRGHQCGLVIVDGRVMTKPVLQALSDGMVDVPFLFGNMGWESGDLGPMTKRQWAEKLRTAFASFGEEDGKRVEDFFMEDTASSPAKANRGILTTYALTCAAPDLARAAKTGRYQSPIYLYMDRWSPAAPVNASGISRWAYHAWDLYSGLETWPDRYVPSEGDLRHSRFWQSVWYDFMKHGALNPAEHAGWRAVSGQRRGHFEYSTMVMANPDTSETGPTMVRSYDASICALFEGMGIGQQYWWNN